MILLKELEKKTQVNSYKNRMKPESVFDLFLPRARHLG